MNISDPQWQILELCSENRETRANLTAHLDLSPNYVSNLLSELRKHNLIKDPGPAENSGMWITSQVGKFALKKQEKDTGQFTEEFIQLINRTVTIATEHNIEPNDVVCATPQTHHLLLSAGKYGADTINLQDVRDAVGDELGAARLAPLRLYELWFYDLIESAPGDVTGEEYPMTDRGQNAANVAADHDTASVDELHDALYS